MSVAQLKGGASSGRAAWRRMLEESKSDMGLLDKTAAQRRVRAILKPWEELKTPVQDSARPFSFEDLLRDTGT